MPEQPVLQVVVVTRTIRRERILLGDDLIRPDRAVVAN
jgi:hypothetical protein